MADPDGKIRQPGPVSGILRSSPAGAISAYFATAFILTIARLKAPFTILLADRFLAGSGWVEIILLASYAAYLTKIMSARKDNSVIRMRIWVAFSIIFFTQFIVGVAGVEKLLMTGRLHVPVPAVVIAGPVYRGGRFFMPILFLSTVLLVGPAWCSHLCYIGGWDGLAATAGNNPVVLSPVWKRLRFGLLAATPTTAILLRVLGVQSIYAGLTAVGFGIAGVGIMAVVSTRKGSMVHCTSVCPLGLVGNVLGKISPFRVRIGETCSDCRRCISVCRYNALDKTKIALRRPGYTCTLCGDCLGSCSENTITYSFLRLSPQNARLIFLTLISSLHAVFLGVARI